MNDLRKKIASRAEELGASLRADIRAVLDSRPAGKDLRKLFHVSEEQHLYALYAMGQLNALQQRLRELDIHDAFWRCLEMDKNKLLEHFTAPELGTWPDAPENPIQELGLIPGDILVMKQHMHTPWEWQHAGLVKDEKSVYTAMCTGDVMVQSIDYFKNYAVRVKALKVIANHENPELGRAACAAAATRVGNPYGISNKWHAFTHKKTPMYCSQVAWYGWLNCGENDALNLDHGCPDYEGVHSIEQRRRKLCSPLHDIVFPGDLARSTSDSAHGFKAKTVCVLDISRPGYEEEARD